VKFLLDELPTRLNLHKRNNQKYSNPYYTRCNTSIEDNTHWWQCPLNQTSINSIIQNTTNEILSQHHCSSSSSIQEISDIIIHNQIHLLTSLTNSTPHIIQGYIPNYLYANIFRHTKKPISKKYSVACLLLHKISKRFYKDIWIPRCQSSNSNVSISTNTLLSTPNIHINPTTSTISIPKNIKTDNRIEYWSSHFSFANQSPDIILCYRD